MLQARFGLFYDQPDEHWLTLTVMHSRYDGVCNKMQVRASKRQLDISKVKCEQSFYLAWWRGEEEVVQTQ